MRLGLALGMLLLAGASCTAQSSPEGAWQVVSLGTTAIEAADDVTLTLADGQASGRSGCNRFTGAYSVDGDGFSFGPLAATRMACPGRASQIEAQFNDVVQSVTGWQIDGEGLVLTDGALPVLRAVPQVTP